MARFPVDVRIGKILLYGKVLRCLDPILTCAAILSVGKSPLSLPANWLENKYFAHHKTFLDTQSDIVTQMNAFTFWHKMIGQKKPTRSESVSFCRQHFLSLPDLQMINDARNHLIGSLGLKGGFYILIIAIPSYLNQYAGNKSAIYSALQAGLYPNILFNEIKLGSEISNLKFPGREGDVKIHPLSVLNKQKLGLACYVFHNIQAKQGMIGKKGQTTVMDLTRMPITSLFLFSGRRLEFNPIQKLVSIDDMFYSKSSLEDASLIEVLRANISSLVEKAMLGENENDDISKDVLYMVIETISAEMKTVINI